MTQAHLPEAYQGGLATITSLIFLLSILPLAATIYEWVHRSNWRTYKISVLFVLQLAAALAFICLASLRRVLGDDYALRGELTLAIALTLLTLWVLTYREVRKIRRAKLGTEELIRQLRRKRRQEEEPTGVQNSGAEQETPAP